MPLYSPSPSLLKWSPYNSFIQPFAPFCKSRCVHSILHAIIGRSLPNEFSSGHKSHKEVEENLLLVWAFEFCDIDSVDAEGLTPLNYAAKLGMSFHSLFYFRRS